MRLLLFVFWICFGGSGFGQIAFDDQFENGVLDSAYYQSGSYTLAPDVSMHVRASGCKDSTPIFRVYDEEGFRLRSYHRMVYRYASDSTWQYFDTGYKAGTKAYYHFHNHSAFIEDTVFIAYWYPWTYSDQTELMTQLEKGPYLAGSGTFGQTPLGHNLYWLEFTDTNVSDCYKQKVVITGRQHPTEFPQGYIIKGLCEYLGFGADSIAHKLLQQYRFLLVPMLNPDGVVLGIGTNSLGQGLNRDWSPGIAPGGCPEVDSTKPFIYQWCDGGATFAIDIHGNAGSNLPYYWWGFNNQSPVGIDSIQRATEYVTAVAQADQLHGLGLFQNFIQGNGINPSYTAANWMYRTLGAIAFTFEPTSEPHSLTSDHVDIGRYEKAGQSLVRGFYQVYSGPEPIHAIIDTVGGWANVRISGGIPPYDVYWNGVNQDSISTVGGGLFYVEVTDSNGCQLIDSIEIESSMGEATRSRLATVSVSLNNNSLMVHGKVGQLGHIACWDLQGRLIMKDLLESNKVTQYDLPSIPKQPLVVTIISKGGRLLFNQLVVP